ncbi:MAG: zeta toxin family protein [Sutterella wadsworthensis]|nr:zeta toxin family protein [Sutterella wadsworthensis]
MTGELTPDQIRARFEERIRPELDRLGAIQKTQGHPVVVFVGGQPGAGKSKSLERIQEHYPGIVPVIGDDLRSYHPDYRRLMRTDPLVMPQVTAHASGRWVEMSIDYLRGARRSTLVETTLRQAGVVGDTAAGFRQAGYRVELHVLAVPLEVSRLGTISRYAGQVAEAGAGRWTSSKGHDVAARAVPATVHDLITSGAIDMVVIENRQGRAYYTAQVQPGTQAVVADRAVEAIKYAWDVSSLAPGEARAWLNSATTAVQVCARTGQSDTDLLATISRTVGHDAPKVAGAAYPGDYEAQGKALDALRIEHRPLAKRSLGQRIEAELAQRRQDRTPEAAPERDTPSGRGRW